MEPFQFDMPKNKNSAIKVIGVGGGGNNAVNYMFNEGIEGVDFIICNTDAQALANSPVPNKVQLGVSITEGLGAGANPEVGEQAALESRDEIKAMFEGNTKMVFVTAGMGGGTGTGAAPVIAGIAKEMGILTVGIVTVPFQFEGNSRLESANKGVEKLRDNVDSLIVINNNKLRDLYGNLGYKSGFSKADEVLATASKGIAEVITQNYTINIDLRDAKTVLSNSGTAIMGSYQAEGEGRAKTAISGALDSPLLNDNKVTGAKNVLLLIVSGTDEITIDEIGVINDYIQSESGNNTNIIMGIGEDEDLGNAINVTIVATGFPLDEQIHTGTDTQKVYHTLRDDQAVSQTLFEKDDVQETMSISGVKNEDIVKFDLDDEDDEEFVSNIQTETQEQLTAEEIEDSLDFTVHSTDKEVTEKPAENIQFEAPLATNIQAETPQRETSIEEKPSQTTIFTLDDFEEEEEQFDNLNETIESKPAEEIQPTEAPKTVVNESSFYRESRQPIANQETPNNSQVINNDKDDLMKKIEERRKRLLQFNTQYENLSQNVEEVEKIPAYKRQGIKLDESQESKTSHFYLDAEEEDINLRPNNFFEDNVD